MRALRAFRVPGKACRTENGDEDAERNSNDVISNENMPLPSKQKIVNQSDSRTSSRGMCSTSSKHSQKTFRDRDKVLPRCFPKFCYRCSEQKENQSMVYEAFVFSRTKVLSIVEHRYFDAFILFIIFISSVSLVSV